MKIKARELNNLGIPKGAAMKLAGEWIGRALAAGAGREGLRERLRSVAEDPGAYAGDKELGELARELARRPRAGEFREREAPAPYRSWGRDLGERATEHLLGAPPKGGGGDARTERR